MTSRHGDETSWVLTAEIKARVPVSTFKRMRTWSRHRVECVAVISAVASP